MKDEREVDTRVKENMKTPNDLRNLVKSKGEALHRRRGVGLLCEGVEHIPLNATGRMRSDTSYHAPGSYRHRQDAHAGADMDCEDGSIPSEFSEACAIRSVMRLLGHALAHAQLLN